MKHYLKNVFVLLTAFLATVAVVIPSYFILTTAMPGFAASTAIVAVAAAIFLTLCLRRLTARYLFDKDDNANVQSFLAGCGSAAARPLRSPAGAQVGHLQNFPSRPNAFGFKRLSVNMPGGGRTSV